MWGSAASVRWINTIKMACHALKGHPTDRRIKRTGQVEVGEDVGAEGAIQLLGRDVHDARLAVLLRGVVDQDICRMEITKNTRQPARF